MKKKGNSLSVIIPAYNEEKRISRTINLILSYLQHRNYSLEIIVVNDGSTDNTLQAVRKIKGKAIKIITYSKNQGKGYAVRKGMLAAKNNLALLCDADLSTPIEELGNFMKFVKNNDIIVGSRVLPGHKIVRKQPFFRVMLGRLFIGIIKIVLGTDIQDTQCGFKLFKNCKSLFKKQKIRGFAFDVEILALAKKQGMSILELPIVWKNAAGSKVNPLGDSLRMFKDIFRIRENFINRAYK
ncbi:MAG: dolichyl-phosphate beta-glucosyltransferase [archaeon]